ncbi:MAG TPA: thioredoxin domain-containing protein [Gaiellaceae bacterium]
MQASMDRNRLGEETSPYLMQHKDNPVHWQAWSEETLAAAQAAQKPILLSIGYAACHWCHVMAHESFENPQIAGRMNQLFVNIKVDREERPDVDGVYMDAVVALTGHGGWPLTVFLTPAGEPFLGGTYFPPEPRHGMPSFPQVLTAVSDLWRERRSEVTQRTEVLVGALREAAAGAASAEPLTESLLFAAVRRLAELRDPEWGGFGGAPKFPPASALELLLRRGEAELAAPTLDGMAAGGMYDLVGGGFHRYSVDAHWLVPHFEKMLYDNALLVPVYLHAWQLTGTERYREVVEETVEYLLRELWLDGGGFASSQDADTDGVEGLTYTWAPGEGAPEELFEPFEDGRFVLRGSLDPDTRARLLELRQARPQPGLDDKAIASWNGLALAALAEAGRRLGREDWLGRARKLGEFLLGPLSDERGRLVRSVRDGRASGAAFLDDYANAAHGLYELHVATGELRWLEESRRLALLAIELFADDEHGGFYLAPSEGDQLVARRKDLFDHPVPSGNSMLAYVLLRLARIWGDDELERQAVGVLRLLGEALGRGPTDFAWSLNALDLYLAPPRELAIVGPPASEVARAALEPYAPNAVVAFGPADGIPLLEGKDFVDGEPAVYVCERFACQRPATTPAELALQPSPK